MGGDRWRRRRDRYWSLAGLCSFGLAAWAGFLYIGVRSGRRAWQVAAGLYGVGALVVVGMAVTRSGLPVLVEWLVLLALWAGSSLHAVAANRRWTAWLLAEPGAGSTPPSAAGVGGVDGLAGDVLEEPWATFVRHAEALDERFRSAAAQVVAAGGLVADVERSVDLVRRLAGHGQVLVTAWQGIDLDAVDAGLATAREHPDEVGDPLVAALEAQRAAADRINQVIAEVIESLRRIDRMLAEVVARVEDLAVRRDDAGAGGAGGTGDAAGGEGGKGDGDGEVVVIDLTALRVILDEVDASGLAEAGPPDLAGLTGPSDRPGVPG
ncbi:MAG TPA: hypothetical protein VIL36_13455 [Acidimicrobiales bacterium]